MTADPILAPRTATLRQSSISANPPERGDRSLRHPIFPAQLEQVPSAYAAEEPRRYEKHVVRNGPLLGLRPPPAVARVLWWTVAAVVVATGLTILRLLAGAW